MNALVKWKRSTRGRWLVWLELKGVPFNIKTYAKWSEAVERVIELVLLGYDLEETKV